MKHCGACGEHYDQRVDFCFRDGEVLAVSIADPVTSEDVRASNRPDHDLPLPSEPPPDWSSLLMAGAVLVFMALLVPVVGGGLVTYSWVAGQSHETAALPSKP